MAGRHRFRIDRAGDRQALPLVDSPEQVMRLAERRPVRGR
jgi:hypothetical protein